MHTITNCTNSLELLITHDFKEEYRSDIMHLKIVEGVLIGEYYPKNARLTHDFMKQVVKERYSFTLKKEYPFLLNIKNLKTISKRAREYSALDEAGYDIKIAAFLIDNVFTMHIANFWLKINKPKTIVKLFTDEEKAFEWLKTHR